MGMIYKRGEIYWIKYYVNGRAVRESSRSEKEGAARSLLKQREGKAEMGEPVFPKVAKICVDDLLSDLRAHYETTGRRTLREVDARLIPLKSFFAGHRASAISGAVIAEYIQRRQAATAANGTINRELSVLGTAFRLGAEHGKVLRPPTIHLLKEATPRQGFFEEGDFRALRATMPADLRVAITIMYTFGWRLSEVLGLRLAQLNLTAGTLRLEPGSTKNREGRVVYLTPELEQFLKEQVERVMALSRKLDRLLPWLFPHLNGCYAGTPRRSFYKVWRAACEKTGLGKMVEVAPDRKVWKGVIPHDFRRTAVRNMERNGVARSVAMKLTGHKTESVYRRYAIVSDADLREATRKLTGTISGTISPPPLDPHRQVCEKTAGLA
jgi:integrase